jgi:glucokinase
VTLVGVDLGGTKCLGVAVRDGEVVAEQRLPTPKGSEQVLDALAAVVGGLRPAGAPEAVGVGAPGLVDRSGTLRFAPNLAVDRNLDLGRALAGRLGVPVAVENDATCAAWGERALGAAQGYDHVLLVTLGTGIGGGIVVDGHVERGANGFAGEVGHMVVDGRGPLCPCGQRGCWERFASGSGLGRLAREAAHAGRAERVVELAGGDPEDVRGEHVTRCAEEGDAQALHVLDEFAWWLALGLVNLANIFDPQAFVLGGGLMVAGELFLEPARRAFSELLAGSADREPIAILPAVLGERAGAVGAAFLAVETSGAAKPQTTRRPVAGEGPRPTEEGAPSGAAKPQTT